MKVLNTAFVGGSVLVAVPLCAADSTLAKTYGAPAWSPYLVGALIGLLVCLSLLAVGKSIGASSAYAALGGLLGRGIFGRRLEKTDYYRKNPPRFGYSLVFLLSVIAGAFLASWQGGELRGEMLPEFWVALFGSDSLGLRFVWATLGGVLLSFGARMAGGCTSGHGISGALQLNAVSWLALICFFIGGVVAAHLIYPI
ncbi:YeeE/YedE thiosulfate transporter family protein [Pelagicoccus sp. SDUM812005]|uniref:YeeE/YedE thiosulfate transporter family protein n=1 Tax=Pelagicoccus sp. SDUM812005 TaxID=3041257 RepID=UPI00280D7C9F|nr:YeeE/YedE thiosulfate transporter family protein [Pelagicoccus sp. SDUM812005]MDQ8181064.1 YeeE/YedE thiosulfate transporter family protein [Pelagicoccus sp. SDUM812005]